MDQVFAALARVPRFASVDPKGIAIEALAGLTNKNYKLTVGGERFVLRIPGAGTSDYIDRKVEAQNARIAAEAEVGAELLFFDAEDGLMLTRFLDGCVTMTSAGFKSDAGSAVRAALALKRMHDCGKPFAFRFELFKMIDDYLKILAKLGAQLPSGYHGTVAEAEGVRKALADHPAVLKPCHCDPLCENFLDNGERMWIVDWEYSGMNDPLWDLGDLAVEAGFDAEQEYRMMFAYCDGEPPAAAMGRMVIYRAMCDLLWTLWGLIQHANKNPVDDFWAYALNRFERCRRLMAKAEFRRHLEAVAAG